MVLSSNVLLFLFLPLFLAVSQLTPDRRRFRNFDPVLIGSVCRKKSHTKSGEH